MRARLAMGKVDTVHSKRKFVNLILDLADRPFESLAPSCSGARSLRPW